MIMRPQAVRLQEQSSVGEAGFRAQGRDLALRGPFGKEIRTQIEMQQQLCAVDLEARGPYLVPVANV
jgi:hypothetical protein